MKINVINVVRRSSGIFGLILTISFGTAFAQAENSGGGRLEGTWDAVVTLRNCANGNPIVVFSSIASFMQGGTTVGSTAGIPQSLRTPEHGVWRHVKGDTYLFKFKSFSFSPAGVPTGWSIITTEIVLDPGGDSYVGTGTAQFFAPDGTQTGAGCNSSVGTRFEL